MSTITDALPISKKDLLNLMNAFIPKGMIAWFELDEAPEGWAIYEPLISRYPLGAYNNIGNRVAAGLPNITGTIGPILEEGAYGKYTDGAFYQTTETGTGHAGGTDYIVKMDASRCSDVYGRSDTVTPPSVKLLPCIKL